MQTTLPHVKSTTRHTRIAAAVFCAFTALAISSAAHAETAPGSAPDASTGLEASTSADFIPTTAPAVEISPFKVIPGSGVRWKENAFGISFELPANSTTGLRPAGDSQVAVAGPGGEYMIDFILRTTDTQPMEFDFLSQGVDRRPSETNDGKPRYLSKSARMQFIADKNSINIDSVIQAAIKQMGDIRPTAIVHDLIKPLTIGKRPAALIYFKIPADTTLGNPGAGNGKATVGKVLDKAVAENTQPVAMRRNDWVLGQAFMMIDPFTVVIFQLDCELANFADVRPKFESMLASVDKEPFQQIDARRKGLLERGELFLKSVKPGMIQASIQEEQWFRILKDKEDVGWMRINQKADQRGKLKGYRVDTQYRLIQGDRAADVLANYFTSEDGNTEFWSSKTAVRSARERKATIKTLNTAGGKMTVEKGALQKPENAPTWVESGVLSNGKIIITRESPTAKEEIVFEQPAKGFLPMIHGHLIETLLPRDAVGEWGFYAYEPRSGDMTFRTQRVQSSPDGSRRVYTRASPGTIELVSEYGADGKLIRKSLAGGLTLVPVSKSQLAALWNFPVN